MRFSTKLPSNVIPNEYLWFKINMATGESSIYISVQQKPGQASTPSQSLQNLPGLHTQIMEIDGNAYETLDI